MAPQAAPEAPPVPIALKILVWGMGALMVLGVLGLVAGMVLKGRSGAGPVAETGALALGPGQSIRHMALDGNRLALHVEEDGRERILLYDARKGRVVGTVEIDRE